MNLGQVSLTRLRRLNNSMFCESGVWNSTEHWLAPKAFIFSKFLIRLLMFSRKTKFRGVWQDKKSNSSFLNRGLKFSFFRRVSFRRRVNSGRSKSKFFFRPSLFNLALYIYSISGKIIVLCVYRHEMKYVNTKRR